MHIAENNLWIRDIKEVLKAVPEISELNGRSIYITGSTGLICSAVVDVLAQWNESNQGMIRIAAAGRNLQKLEKRFEPYIGKTWFSTAVYDAASDSNAFGSAYDYIIHGASNASPSKIVKEPVETMLSNFLGMKYLLDFARQNNVRRVLFISSSEVYGKKEGNRPFQSDEYGYVDLLNARNSYSVSKRAAETLCASYHDEYGVDSVIVRPGHIYGPTAGETDNRVSSAWAYAVARGEDIVMKSDGAQLRSYCYCLDCASAIIKVLLKGQCVTAYNISNCDSIISIREMAEVLTRANGVKLSFEIPTEMEKKGFNPMSNSSLDSTELENLGWKGLFDAERGLSHTVEILKQCNY